MENLQSAVQQSLPQASQQAASSDSWQRQRALEFAVGTCRGIVRPAEVVDAAEMYLKFLTSKKEQ